VTGYNGERVLALAAKDVTGNAYELAAVQGKGIYRKVNGSAWALVNSNVLSSSATLNAPIAWDTSKPYAYLYDRETGVWRGSSNGSSWGTSPIYSAPTSTVNSNDTGYLAVDSANDTLYISNSSGLYYQTNASTATFSPVQISLPSGVEVGPIAFVNGILYVCGLATNSGTLPTADIYTYTSATGLQSIGDAFYQANAGFPYAIDVDSVGNIYVGMQGSGVIVGK
jgi:hypothetical protein